MKQHSCEIVQKPTHGPGTLTSAAATSNFNELTKGTTASSTLQGDLTLPYLLLLLQNWGEVQSHCYYKIKTFFKIYNNFLVAYSFQSMKKTGSDNLSTQRALGSINPSATNQCKKIQFKTWQNLPARTAKKTESWRNFMMLHWCDVVIYKLVNKVKK